MNAILARFPKDRYSIQQNIIVNTTSVNYSFNITFQSILRKHVMEIVAMLTKNPMTLAYISTNLNHFKTISFEFIPSMSQEDGSYNESGIVTMFITNYRNTSGTLTEAITWSMSDDQIISVEKYVQVPRDVFRTTAPPLMLPLFNNIIFARSSGTTTLVLFRPTTFNSVFISALDQTMITYFGITDPTIMSTVNSWCSNNYTKGILPGNFGYSSNSFTIYTKI